MALHVGMKVYVKGTIQESEGQKWIRVSVFEILKEQPGRNELDERKK